MTEGLRSPLCLTTIRDEAHTEDELVVRWLLRRERICPALRQRQGLSKHRRKCRKQQQQAKPSRASRHPEFPQSMPKDMEFSGSFLEKARDGPIDVRSKPFEAGETHPLFVVLIFLFLCEQFV